MPDKHVRPGEWLSDEQLTNRNYNRILKELKKKNKTSRRKRRTELKPYVVDSLVQQYQFFQEIFGIPERVFYPCCDLEISATKGFPDSKVIYLDKKQETVEILKKHGLESICMDIKYYRPTQPYDLLIVLNPQLSTNNLVHTLKRGGMIIANNYHHNTKEMLNAPKRYTFLGLIDHQTRPLTLVNRNGTEKILAEYSDFLSIFRKI